MTPLAEADLLRMREVQAQATPGRCQVHRFDGNDGTISYQVQQEETGVVLCEFPDITSPNPRAKADAAFEAAARTDWPRLTEWALEARRIIHEMLRAYPWRGSNLADEARRLLGE